MRRITLSEVCSLLKENNNFHILTHNYPDGDTLGSGFALCCALRKLGKKANVIVDGNFPSKFTYLKETYTDQNFVPQYIVSVDVASRALLTKNVQQEYENIDLCIDHHATNTMVADNVYADGQCAACCEIIYQIILDLGLELDEDIAAAIYTGVSTDTGCFCYSNTTENTHIIAAKVMPYCDWKNINQVNFAIKSRAKLKMERMVYDTMEFYAGGKCAIIYTTLAMQKALGAGDDEMEGLASIPREIEGVLMGITMRQKDDGSFKISVRTNGDIDAAQFAAKFGGGGHKGAAGCSIKGDLSTVKYKLIKAAEEFL